MIKLIKYTNYKGGVNNLQVVYVIGGNNNTVKVFTSTKGLAEKRADIFIKNLNKTIWQKSYSNK